jgi:alpha-1,3-glucosyltransferase
LFEDKVANFWCASDVIIKWKRKFSREQLTVISLAATAAGFLIPVVGLIRGGIQTKAVGDQDRQEKNSSETMASMPTPTLPLLPYALLTSSLSFFLFSFQVHEKTILLPLMPMTMLLSGSAVGSSVFEWGVLVNNAGLFR